MRVVERTPILGFVAGLAAALALGGCSSGSLPVETAMAGTTLGGQLDARRPVLIAIPEDGGHGGRISLGSGPRAAQLIAAAFSNHAPRVDLAAAGGNNEEMLLEAARRDGAGYLVMLAIASWEPRATNEAAPGRSIVAVAIFDVASGQEIRSAILDGASGRITLASTSTEPLPAKIGRFVDSLYGQD
jgi:Domain of unknown function (DUF4823)